MRSTSLAVVGAKASERKEAADPKTTQERLTELAPLCPDVVALNPNTPIEVLFDLAKEYPKKVLRNSVLVLLSVEAPDVYRELLIHIRLYLAAETVKRFAENHVYHHMTLPLLGTNGNYMPATSLEVCKINSYGVATRQQRLEVNWNYRTEKIELWLTSDRQHIQGFVIGYVQGDEIVLDETGKRLISVLPTSVKGLSEAIGKKETDLPTLLASKEAQKILKDLPGGARSWSTGGCWVLARALQLHLGGELVIVRETRGPIEHVALKLPKQPVTCYIDGDGVHTSREAFIGNLKKRLPIRPRIVPFTKDEQQYQREKGTISFSQKSVQALKFLLAKHRFQVGIAAKVGEYYTTIQTERSTFDVWKNPSFSELDKELKLKKGRPVRGLVVGDDIYFWDAHSATHAHVTDHMKLQLKNVVCIELVPTNAATGFLGDLPPRQPTYEGFSIDVDYSRGWPWIQWGTHPYFAARPTIFTKQKVTTRERWGDKTPPLTWSDALLYRQFMEKDPRATPDEIVLQVRRHNGEVIGRKVMIPRRRA